MSETSRQNRSMETEPSMPAQWGEKGFEQDSQSELAKRLQIDDYLGKRIVAVPDEEAPSLFAEFQRVVVPNLGSLHKMFPIRRGSIDYDGYPKKSDKDAPFAVVTIETARKESGRRFAGEQKGVAEKWVMFEDGWFAPFEHPDNAFRRDDLLALLVSREVNERKLAEIRKSQQVAELKESQQVESDIRTARHELLKGAVGENFDRIPQISFSSSLPDTEVMKIMPQADGRFEITLSSPKPENGRREHRKVRVGMDGTIEQYNGKLYYNHDAVLNELARNIKSLDLKKLVVVDFEIFPPGEGPERGPETGEADDKKRGEDDRRLAFLSRQKEMRFSFISNASGGFDSYHGFVFPGFVLMENPQIGNAAYFIDLPRDAGDPESLQEDSRTEWVNAHIRAALTQPRKIVSRAGAKVIIHRGESWEKKIQAEIDRRLSDQVAASIKSNP